jgi:hypothetical protein
MYFHQVIQSVKRHAIKRQPEYDVGTLNTLPRRQQNKCHELHTFKFSFLNRQLGMKVYTKLVMIMELG